MHNIKRQSQILETSRIESPGQAGATTITSIATDAGTQQVLTSWTRTLEETRTQPGTTFVTTYTNVLPITDSAVFSSLQASDASVSAARTTSSSTESSPTSAKTSTAADKGTSSNNLGTLIPAIVVPVVAILLISFVLFWFVMRRRHQRQLKREPEFVMASKPEKQISRGNSNSSGHSSTRELVPMSKMEKEMSFSKSEAKKSPTNVFPPQYSSPEIGVARPMTPPEAGNRVSTMKEKSFTNFSSIRPGAPHKSRLSQDRTNKTQDFKKSANAQNAMLPPRSDSRSSPPKSATRGPPAGVMRGIPDQSTQFMQPGDQNSRSRGASPSRGHVPPPIMTNMKNGNRASPPKPLNPPTPTGAFNGSSPISQYSPIVKSPFSLDAIAASTTPENRGQAPLSFGLADTTSNYGKSSPVDDGILSKENMRIARLTNSSRPGLSSSPIESNLPSKGNSNTRNLSRLSEGQPKSDPASNSPRLPPPLIREDVPLKPFAHVMNSPAAGSSIYPSPSIGGPTPRIGVGPSMASLPHNGHDLDVDSSANPYMRESMISRVSSDDGYVDMDVDAKSDVSSLDERERWEMESDQHATGSRLGTGYNGSGYGSVGMSPIDGPTGQSSASTGTTKPSIRDRDSEGPFVLSRY